MERNKIDIFFSNITDIVTSFTQGVLFFVWSVLLTIVRSPVFWPLVIAWVVYYIVTYPNQPVQYCPSCQQLIH